MSVAFVTGILIVCISGSYGLRCYECVGCNDVFNDKAAKNATCSGSCAKTKRDDSGYVERYCTPGHPEPDCLWIDSAKWGDSIAVCACNTDLCNSASLIGYSVTCISGCVLMFWVQLFKALSS